MYSFYVGEISGSINPDKIFTCYIIAKSNLDAENKLVQYFDNNLMSTMGEIVKISIINIETEEYYGSKKSRTSIFI